MWPKEWTAGLLPLFSKWHWGWWEQSSCPGPFQDGKAGHRCGLGSQKSASRWCTRFISGLSVGNVGCYHWQCSSQNLFNFLTNHLHEYVLEHPSRKRWISLVQSCVHSTFSLLFSNCSPAAEQKLFWHQRQHDRKSQRSGRITKKKAELPEQSRAVGAISTARNVERMEIPWRHPKPDCRGSCWTPGSQSPLPALHRSSPSCASRGVSPIPLQGRASSNSMAALQLTSAPSCLPVPSAAVSSSIIEIKSFFMNLSWAPALLQVTDQWGQLSPCALGHPCLAPNPTGVIPQLPAGTRAAWKAWLHTEPGKVQFTPS